ncbi:MAG: cupin domain-containing protein [Planctomycetota bacterium]
MSPCHRLLSTCGIFLCLLATWPTNCLAFDDEAERQDSGGAERILQMFVEDFRADRFAAMPRTFGINVPGHGQWTVDVAGKKTGDQWGVSLRKGLPSEATFVYRVEFETLRAIDAGKMNAMTAQGKAFKDDYTPMSVTHMKGYEPTLAEVGEINPFSFHFWTRGFPEKIPFRSIRTRKAHGSQFGIFYYQPGFRSGWYRVMPGDRVHDGPRERAMPFPMLAVATKGTTEGEIDGVRISLSAGNAVFIPPHAEHRWWNAGEEPSEAIVLMFGEGA